jgi:hypothetical protein
MTETMHAEVLFLNPAERDAALPKLIEQGLTIIPLDDWTDPYGPTVWLVASARTELSEIDFLLWITNLAASLGGDAVSAGLGWDPSWGERRADPQTLEN